MSSVSRITVNQSLHGYAHGHQQLASSMSLKPRDNKLMLTLSDISGPGLQIGSEGYLTGYPLPEAKAYVLARTWLAPEMPRPGCVWTHSLIVDFSDLPALQSPASLLSLFRRPEECAPSAYGGKITLALSEAEHLNDVSADFGRRLLKGLYDNPRSKVVGIRPASVDTDFVTTALWFQQWPRLRRTFRFCTLSGTDRSNENAHFDLQLFPAAERGGRSRVTNSVDLQDIDLAVETWLEDAFTDLVQPDSHQLRSFMRKMGADVDAGREAFRSICRLHTYLGSGVSSSSDIHEAIEVLQTDFPSGSGLARSLVASKILEQGFFDDKSLGFFVTNYDDFLKRDPTLLASGFGAALWRYNPGLFARLVGSFDGPDANAKSVWATLSDEDLSAGLKKDISLLELVIRQRPDILSSNLFLGLLAGRDEHAALALLDVLPASVTDQVAKSVLTVLILSERGGVAPAAARRFGRANVLHVLAGLFAKGEFNDRELFLWIDECVSDFGDFAKFLADAKDLPLLFLEKVALRVSPDDVPNEYGDDPWILAVRSAEVSTKRSEQCIFLRCFLAARAFGYRSRNRADLVQFAFEPLYKALGADKVPNDWWRLVEARLPWVLTWRRWDRCERLMNAVSELFVDRDLSAHIFAQICDDDRLFDSMARAAAGSFRGRQYLRYVLCELEKLGPEFTSRCRSVRKIVDHSS